MNAGVRPGVWLLAFALLSAAFGARAADDDLPGLPEADAPAPASAPKALRLSLEAALGRVDARGGDHLDLRRAALDVRYEKTWAPWRIAVSNRLDDFHPVQPGQRSTRNSLREALVGWNGESATVEAGRINLRNGPAFGYNPTDYFRESALRTITTADPVALRENRLGTVMLRGAVFSGWGSASLALAPKVDSDRSDSPMSADFGRTNRTDRALLTVSSAASQRLSGQVLVFGERGRGTQVGVNATALLSDAMVAYGEATTGRDTDLLQDVFGQDKPQRRLSRASLGFTYTLPVRLSITLEGEYNGAGLDRAGQETLARGGAAAYARFVDLTQSSLEIGSRRAWIVHMAQKDAGIKNLDVGAFVRTNAVDHSRLYWAEARYHWQQFDAAVQWQRFSGRPASEFGGFPYRQVIQVIGVYYF
jgi:hypothetical protein